MTSDELLYEIKSFLKEQENSILYYKKENELLRDSAYKDLELDRMRDARDKARLMLKDSFYISQEDKNAIAEWQEEHSREHDGVYPDFSYVFKPTSYYTLYSVKCNECGEEFCYKEDF